MEFMELEVPVEKYPGISTPPTRGGVSHTSSSNSSLNVRHLGRGDSRENWDPIRSAREREFREKPPPMLKIAVVGDSAVGKTTICDAFTSETGFTFSKKYHMTCGVSVYAKSVRMPTEAGDALSSSSSLSFSAIPSEPELTTERVNLILLDSSSKDIYKDLLPKYWEKLDGVALVMDVTNPATLDNCKGWLELVKVNLDPKLDMLGVLIGNKTDCGDERTVSEKAAKEFAQELNLNYFEACANEFHASNGYYCAVSMTRGIQGCLELFTPYKLPHLIIPECQLSGF